jgi:hypothetical protein
MTERGREKEEQTGDEFDKEEKNVEDEEKTDSG